MASRHISADSWQAKRAKSVNKQCICGFHSITLPPKRVVDYVAEVVFQIAIDLHLRDASCANKRLRLSHKYGQSAHAVFLKILPASHQPLL